MKPTTARCVFQQMRRFVLVLAIAACGGKQQTATPNGGDDAVAPVKDTRTPLEQRRDTACEPLGARITACAVEDAKRDLAAGKTTQQQFDQDTSAGVQRKNTEEFVKACKQKQYSSRQVRVLEVCQSAESQCDPLLACLDNLNKP